MTTNGIIDDATGDLLRAGFADFTAELRGGQSIRNDVPASPQIRGGQYVDGLMHRWVDSPFSAQFAAGSLARLDVESSETVDATEGWFSLWAWRDGAQANFATIMELSQDGTHRVILYHAASDDDDLSVFVQNGGASSETASASSWFANQTWMHLLVRWDATSYWLYVDGTPVIGPVAHGNGDFGDWLNARISLGHGTPDYPNNYWNGRLDNTGLFVGPWNDAYLTELYNGASPLAYSAMSAPLRSVCAAYWELDEAAGATRVDQTGTFDLADTNTVVGQTPGAVTGAWVLVNQPGTKRPTESLAQAKFDRCEAIDHRTRALLALGFSHLGLQYPIDAPRFQAYRNASSSLSYPVTWSTISGLDAVSLADEPALLAMIDDGEATLRARIDSGETLKASVRAASTVQEVQDVADNRT